MQTCSRCGTANRNNAKFCANCATPLTSTPSTGLTGLLPANSLLRQRYLILRKVGQGGMAAVYQAQDTSLPGKLWAVKEMSSAQLTDPLERQTAMAAFFQEGQLLASLNHPNLPRVVDSFEENGKQFLVMDFIEGQSLKQIADVTPGFLSESQVLGWMNQLCDVLEYLHTHQPPIIFRDLKPANIMLTSAGQIKLIDFGIARFFKRGKTKDTTPFGTVGYAAPEQFGTGQTDARSDVYSLGVTLHTLLTKYDPSQSPFNLPPARTLNPQVSPQTETVITRATLSAPEQRFQSAREMKQALHPVIDHQPMPFVFRGGEQARNVTELVRLCENKPSDAVYHLESGHFEPWLVSIGQPALAQAATMARQSTGGATERLKQFIALTGVPSTLTGSQNAGGQSRYSREFVFDESRAGGLRRFFGLGIDLSIILVLLSFVISVLGRTTSAQATAALIFSGVALYLYFVLAWMIAGQTIGQMIVGIRVMRTDGTFPGFWTATGRWIVMAITVTLCWGLIPYLILAYLWNRFRKPPHDRFANTEAIRTRFMAKQYPSYDLVVSGRQYFGVFLSAVICSVMLPLGAAGVAGLGSVAMAPAPTPAPTSAPPTAAPTRVAVVPTQAPTVVPTAVSDASVEFAADLRVGPAFSFDTVGLLTPGQKLKIVGRDSTAGSDWILVRDDLNRQGWVRASQVKVNVSLTSFTALTPPPTSTPRVSPSSTIAPTRTLTPTPKVCPPIPALVQINNYLDVSLSITLNGPNTATIVYVPQGSFTRVCLPQGTYSYTLRASGYRDNSGVESFTQETNIQCIHWDWTPLSMIGKEGPCSPDASLYSVP